MADVHEVASGMPHVTKWERDDGTDRPVYQVGGKSFVFFRTPRPDAVDPVTGEKYDDVIMIWVESEDEKLALVSDESTPFFTTPTSTATRRSSSAAANWARSPSRS